MGWEGCGGWGGGQDTFPQAELFLYEAESTHQILRSKIQQAKSGELSLPKSSQVHRLLVIATKGWWCIIDWLSDATISVWRYVTVLLRGLFFDGWLFHDVPQGAALNKLSTGRVVAFPRIIWQMTDSSALHLSFSFFTSSSADTELYFSWRKRKKK